MNEKQELVYKKFNDGAEDPSDIVSYAYYHMKRLQKTNSITDDVKLVFADLTAEEISSSFLRSTSPQRREQLFNEIKYGVLFENALWLANAK